MSRWYYAKNKQKTGPVTIDELKVLVRAGELKPTDMVLEEGALKWIAASTVPGLFTETAATTPSAPASNKSASRLPSKFVMIAASVAGVLFLGCCGTCGLISMMTDKARKTSGADDRAQGSMKKTDTPANPKNPQSNDEDGKAKKTAPTKTPTIESEIVKKNPKDFDLSWLGFPKSMDFTKGPNGEGIKWHEYEEWEPAKSKFYYYLDVDGKKVKHGIRYGYSFKGNKTLEEVYVNGKLRLRNGWHSNGLPYCQQNYHDAEWNLETYTEYWDLHSKKLKMTKSALARYVTTKKTGENSETEVWDHIPHGPTLTWTLDGKFAQSVVYEKGKLVSVK